MFVKNNWMTTNLKERMLDPCLDFYANMEYQLSDILDFNIEADNVANLIRDDFNNKICIAFSGGMDSEYVVRIFHRNKIDFIPVIVLCNDNLSEARYALDVCRELNIQPEILHLKDKELRRIIYYDIVYRLKSVGLYAAPHIFASYYARQKNYTLVCGAEMLDTEGYVSQTKIGINDWDIYPFGLYPETSVSIPFFYYTYNLFFSYIKNIDRSSMDTIQDFKTKLYSVKNRPKIKPKYSN